MAADSTPLLSQTQSSDPETPTLHKHQYHFLDDTIERCIGGDFGCAQFLQILLVSLAWVFDAQQLFISVFADAHPTWHCTQLGPDDDSCNSMITDICRLPKNSWAWDFPIDTSIISEWSLECAGSIITGLPVTSFFLGCMVGGLLLATLADSSLGRKNMLLLSSLLMSVAGLLTVFSTNIWIYSSFKFVSGFGRATIGTCSLVLSTELVGKKWRGQVGIIGFLCSTIGFLSLPLIAYLNRGSSWRLLYIWTCTPAIFYCVSVYFLVPESPRWLFVRGRKEEFLATLKHIAHSSFSSLTLSFSGMSEQESRTVDLYSAVKIMLQKRWAIRRLWTVMAVGFGVGILYYGLPLGVGNLAFNLYLGVTFNALSEVPASLVTLFVTGRLNRKTAVLGFTVLSGVCCVMCVVLVKDELQMLAEMVSFFSACTAFNMLLIYTMELFPTCVRNSAVAIVRQALILGGVFSPLLVGGGHGHGKTWYGVFGVTTGCCGLFVVCLPETKGGTLCDTMDEEEQKERAAALYLPSHP